MSIDTHMPGSPASVHAVGDWLDRMERELGESVGRLHHAAQYTVGVWEGKDARAYQGFNLDITKAHQETEDRAKTASDRIHAYGQYLSYRQADMAEYRSWASSQGLQVNGTVIVQPAPAGPVPAMPDPSTATPEQVDAYNQAARAWTDAAAKERAYELVKKDVEGTFKDLREWITKNLGDMDAKLTGAGIVAGVLTQIAKKDSVVGGLMSSVQTKFEKRAQALSAAATRRAEEAARAASRNPAVRAGAQSPREEAVKRRLDKSSTMGKAQKAGKIAAKIGRAAPVVGILFGLADIANGASPSSTGVEFLGGLAGGALGAAAVGAGAAALGVTAPVWAPVAGAVIVGGAVAWGATKAYEAWVPDTVRTRVDEGARDLVRGPVRFFTR